MPTDHFNHRYRRNRGQRLSSEAQRRHGDEMSRLHGERGLISGELKELSELLETERKRLTESLRAALGVVDKTLTPSKEMSKHRPTPVPTGGGFLDEIEAHIDEDAAAAAPSIPSPDDAGDAEDEGGRANLAAVPPLEDSGPPTEAWHSEPMDFFSSGGAFAGAVVVVSRGARHGRRRRRRPTARPPP